MSENRLKISNPQRVTRILRRICQASLQVMIRIEAEAAVAVKGRAASIILDTEVPTMRISNISDKGVMHLAAKARIQVEFIMMSTKVVFQSVVIAREQNSILIQLPASLISIERRKNARHNCTDDMAAFLNLSVFRPEKEDLTAPPFFDHFRSLSSYLAIADLSYGGLCAVTRFPAVNTVLRRGLIDDQAKLVLPMQPPIPVGVEVRWFKRIKEHVKGGDEGSFMRSYRFGVEFVTQSDAASLAIRQFIQQLSQAGAI
jgi:hypothetical protein